MAAGSLRAVVATSSLDLGIDWGGVDQVIQVGAPKGVSPPAAARRPRQPPAWTRPSRAILVPANRFEVLECEAAVLGVAARELDGDPPRPGGLDVLAQHILLTACAAPFDPDALYREIDQRRALRRARRAGISTTCSASSRTAATRSPPTTATASCSATARDACMSAPSASRARRA